MSYDEIKYKFSYGWSMSPMAQTSGHVAEPSHSLRHCEYDAPYWMNPHIEADEEALRNNPVCGVSQSYCTGGAVNLMLKAPTPSTHLVLLRSRTPLHEIMPPAQ